MKKHSSIKLRYPFGSWNFIEPFSMEIQMKNIFLAREVHPHLDFVFSSSAAGFPRDSRVWISTKTNPFRLTASLNFPDHGRVENKSRNSFPSKKGETMRKFASNLSKIFHQSSVPFPFDLKQARSLC